jgi:hypothetical protein
MGVGGYGGIYLPKDLHTSGQNWLGGHDNFFHVVKNFSEKPATFFVLLAAGEIFGSLGVYRVFILSVPHFVLLPFLNGVTDFNETLGISRP